MRCLLVFVVILMTDFLFQGTAVAEPRGITAYGKLSAIDQKLNDAVWEGDVQTVANSLREGANPDTVLEARLHSARRSTPVLLAAAYHANLELEVRMQIVRLLLKHGADITATNEYGYTALHGAASKHGNGSLVSLLLEYGADANAKIYLNKLFDKISDLTPLHAAIYPQDMEVLEILVKHGADVNAVANGGSAHGTPLMVAVRMTRINAAKFLLKHGAEVDKAIDTECVTPLHVALKSPLTWRDRPQERTDMVKLLLQYEPATNIENKYGRTALEEAYITKEAKSWDKQPYIKNEMDTPIKILKTYMSKREKLTIARCGS